MSNITQNIDALVCMCQRSGSSYIAQSIVGLIDDILQNTRNIGYTITFKNLKTKIKNTKINQTSLSLLYKDVLYIINEKNIKTPEAIRLKTFIEILQEKSIY